MKRHVVHPYSPVIHQESKVLILGTVPSLKSMKMVFIMDILKIVFGE